MLAVTKYRDIVILKHLNLLQNNPDIVILKHLKTASVSLTRLVETPHYICRSWGLNAHTPFTALILLKVEF
jgi:hypothetical protein